MPPTTTRPLPALITALTLLALATGTASAGAVDDRPRFQFELANDMVLSSDNQFTNGVGFHYHSTLAEALEQTGGTPAFGRILARPFLPADSGLHYRETWVLGQTIQTPDDIETPDLILNDVPYTGALTWSNSYYAFDNDSFHGFQWLLGWAGTDAHADSTQKAVHYAIGGDNPRGWHNQLSSEPLLNIHYAVKRKVYDNSWMDAAVSGDLALGNLMTFAQTGMELRFGKRPGGFAYLPDPPGRGLDNDATLRAPGTHYLYGTMTARATAIGFNMATDGNLLRNDNDWTERNTVSPNTWVGQLILGAHYTAPSWGAHLTLWLSTDTVDQDGLADSEDPRNSFGSLLLEYRF